MPWSSLISNLLRRPRSASPPPEPQDAPDRPSVPAGKLVYAIGDIHGRKDLLEKLLDLILKDAWARTLPAAPPLVLFLGDYIDRGPDSRGVIDCLLTALPAAWTCRFIKGNHEEAMLEFLRDPQFGATWRDYGALETLHSYGVVPRRDGGKIDWEATAEDFAAALPAAHRQFLDRLSPFEVVGDYIFVHAGLRPGLPLDFQSEKDLFWIRDDFLIGRRAHEKTIVHGHTPGETVLLGPGRIGIDTGAYMTGRLTALGLQAGEHWFLST
jgi:serine/threonine protein phosphatase 1